MRYPTLTRSKAVDLAGALVSGRSPSVEAQVDWSGAGSDLNLARLAEVAREITETAKEWTDSDRDRFEGTASSALFAALSDVPTEVLDDRGFWRYLALRHFWEFIAWREEAAFARGNYLKYVDANSSTESVLPRMFLRICAVGGTNSSKLAASIPHSTDFWRSHVLRVRTGSSPTIAKAFAQRQLAERLPTDRLRETARKLNRTSTNVVLSLYRDEEAHGVLDRVWSKGVDG